MNEAQATADLLRRFQNASREQQDEAIRGFQEEANKPCETCGRFG